MFVAAVCRCPVPSPVSISPPKPPPLSSSRAAVLPHHGTVVIVFTALLPLECTAPPPSCLCLVAAWLRCPCRVALLL
ncbi:hypothetical protein E2562_026443 [Oryza meyeriana var. granulata]|uniref:Uncharacterized protein n=1 Tax=Oryza meyeriana var. granulata TaxID=110450 RepID=A0A6G1FCS6_9ORYZ|nr:hypothetical protein E2562_026443 [Oryza meyeriana var. granulata]